MAWFSVHIEISDHPKFKDLIKELGCSRAEAEGLLNFLWKYGVKFANRNGLFSHIDKEDIEAFIDYENRGPKGVRGKEAVSAFIKAGFLDESEEGLRIHDWETWQESWQKEQDKKETDAARYQKSKTKKKAPAPKNDEEQIAFEGIEPTKPVKYIPKYTDEFEKLWEAYPRKVGKEKAQKCYFTRLKEGFSHKDMIDAAEAYAKECKKLRTEQEYIKHPATFLGPSRPFAEYISKEENKESKEVEKKVSHDVNPFQKWSKK